MASYLPTFNMLLLVSVLFTSLACSNQAKKDVLPSSSDAPLFEVTLHVPVEQGTHFFDTFRRYATSNNLVAIDLDDAPITFGDRREDSTLQINDSQYATLNSPVAIDLDGESSTGDRHQGSIFQINDKRGHRLFTFDNFIFQNVFELAAYPSDIPLAQQHIYNLVQTLTATFQGRIELKSCNKAILDCDRLTGLLQLSCTACSLQVARGTDPDPMFIMRWNIPVADEKHFIDTFLGFVTSNKLAGIDSLKPTPEEIRKYSHFLITTEQKNPQFVFRNFPRQDEFELMVHLYDTPLAQQHIYNLVKTLTTNFHGRTELILCEAKALDCARLKNLLQVK